MATMFCWLYQLMLCGLDVDGEYQRYLCSDETEELWSYLTHNISDYGFFHVSKLFAHWNTN